MLRLPTGKELREKRLELSLTQQEVASRAKMSQPLVARIEKEDVDPRYSTVKRLVAVLNEAATEKLPVARDLIRGGIASVGPTDPVKKAAKIMRERGFSQLPVLDGDRPVGLLSVLGLIQKVQQTDDPITLSTAPVENVMGPAPPSVPDDTRFVILEDLLSRHDAVLVSRDGRFVGIITKADILSIL
jgi:predicted transcriptional regulator